MVRDHHHRASYPVPDCMSFPAALFDRIYAVVWIVEEKRELVLWNSCYQAI